MRKLSIIILSFLVSACASVESLQTAKTCQVWQNQKVIGPRSVEVKGNKARYTGKCTIMGLFGCLWAEAEINQETGRISLKGNSIFEGKKEVASLTNNTINFDSKIWDSFVKSSPATINLDKGEIKRTITLTMLGLDKSSPDLTNFNQNCKLHEVAIGAIALWAGKVKDAS